MQVVRTRAGAREWSARSRRAGRPFALVPTLGSLHDGHTSLVEIARRAGARTALSIFVNPLQFGPDEDFERYPRDLERDLSLAEAAGVDLAFAPAVAEMYPEGEPWIAVVPEKGTDRLCGLSRPGHFRGVLTIVAKLLGIFTPDFAVFGQKDYQQLTLIRHMVADLEISVEILAGPTVREPDGLAVSSRNRYLSPGERSRGLALVRALRACAELFDQGERQAASYRRLLHRAGDSGVSLEYGEVVDPLTLDPVTRVEHGTVCAVAAHVGNTRLIDNIILGPDSFYHPMSVRSTARR